MKKRSKTPPPTGLFDPAPTPIVKGTPTPTPVRVARPEPENPIVLGQKYTWKHPTFAYIAVRFARQGFVFIESPSGRELCAPAEELKPHVEEA